MTTANSKVTITNAKKQSSAKTVNATSTTAGAAGAVEFRYGDRGVIRVGDTFRARGGPTFRKSRVGEPGLYRMLGIECGKLGRRYLECVPVDRLGVQKGGVRLLFVEGKPHRLAGLPEWICRPYRVTKLRG